MSTHQRPPANVRKSYDALVDAVDQGATGEAQRIARELLRLRREREVEAVRKAQSTVKDAGRIVHKLR
jgi:DNA-binding FadR family transcriptional regulator